MKTQVLFLTLLFAGFASINAQTTMNIYQSNGTVLQIPISSIDSITYTVNNPGNLATLTTLPVGNITNTSSTSGGSISATGGSSVTQRGVCWSTSQNPTTANSSTNNGSGTGSFNSNLTGLTANTAYYLRAYAINSAGTSYGNQQSFTTTNSGTGNLATLTTSSIGNITNTSSTSGGSISATGGSSVTQRGVCWSTTQNPTTANSSTNNGSGSGSFTSNLTGLTASTTYYVRAYAINSAGTSYGNQQSFTTTTSGSGIVSNPGAGITYNGYTYSSVVLGNGQEWMSENLRTANYRNGDPIPTGLDNATWSSSTSGAYAIYSNDNANDAIYGKLYNWYAVADPRHVCPTGWHEPTDGEWTALTDYLGGAAVAGGKMKTTGLQYWISPNADATNESGFSGLPGGGRYSNGDFYFVGSYGSWWSSSEYETSSAWYRFLDYGNGDAYRDDNDKQSGFSVRCLRD